MSKHIKNWLSGLRYKFSDFGLRRYSVVEDPSCKNGEKLLIKMGNFDKTYLRGEGERVGVLDTGVDYLHEEIQGRVDAASFTPNDSSEAYDFAGHGTFMVGQVIGKTFGVAPMATCLSCKVLYGDGRDSNLHEFEKSLAKAITYACQSGCGVISMSLGSPHRSKLVEDALNEAVSMGVIPISSAGNEGLRGSPYKSYPASFIDCISVGSADQFGYPSWFSTSGHGKNVLEQPEVAIASYNMDTGILPDNRYGVMTGTSTSCPVVAGVALLWREKMRKENKMPEGGNVMNKFREWLHSTCEDTNKNGWDNELGFGVLRLKPWESL